MIRRIELPEIDDKDILKIRKYLKNKYYSYHGVRNQVLVAILLTTGLKTEPLVALNINDYNRQRGILIPKHPKAPRQIKLDGETRRLLNSYLLLREQKLSPIFINSKKRKIPPLFINELKQEFHKNIEDLRLSARQIQRIIKSFAKRLGLSNNFSPKSFRHLTGLYYTRLGLDNKTIDDILGNVAPWVKTDYRRLTSQEKLTVRRKDLRPACKRHNVKMDEAEHKKYGAIWLCPIRGCTFILDDQGKQLI